MASWQPIPESELRLLLAENVLRLDADTFRHWERLSVAPVQIPCQRRNLLGGPPATDPIFVVASAADEVLIYDDVEEEFGTGSVDPDGVLRNWVTYGEELRWALEHFPSAAAKPTA